MLPAEDLKEIFFSALPDYEGTLDYEMSLKAENLGLDMDGPWQMVSQWWSVCERGSIGSQRPEGQTCYFHYSWTQKHQHLVSKDNTLCARLPPTCHSCHILLDSADGKGN